MKDSGAKLLFVDGERHERLKQCYAALPDLEQVVVSRACSPIEGDAVALESILGPCNSWADLTDIAFPEVGIAPDDDVTLFYTSGTTGHPKGAVGTHRNLMTNILTSGYSVARSMLRRGE